jgi:hypothetical protein
MRLLAPGLGALLAACSAGVDDYRILDDGIGGDSGGASVGGGKVNDHSGGRSGGGGTVPDASAGGTTDSGGAGGAPSSGGAETGGGISAGGTNTGGTSTGGANTGGTNTGGTNTGGTNTGGTNTGGTNTGGASTGGTSTGGTSTGGANTGGANTGGTGGVTFGQPVVVTQQGQPSGITAAAWDGQYFWVLNPTAKTFYRINPVNRPATVTGPYNLPGTTLAPRVFGASTTHVYLIADGKAYQVPNAGSTTVTGVNFGTTGEMTQLRGAYAGGYLLVGRADALSTTPARWFNGTTVANAGTITAVGRVATDGATFAIARASVNSTADVHRVVPGSWTLNATPCNRGSFNQVDLPLGISYAAVAWALPGLGQRPRLNVSRIPNGACDTLGEVYFGAMSTSGHAIGLLSETHAVVVETFTAGAATLSVKDMVTFQGTPETAINMGGTAPREIIVGGNSRYALVVGENVPVLVTF